MNGTPWHEAASAVMLGRHGVLRGLRHKLRLRSQGSSRVSIFSLAVMVMGGVRWYFVLRVF